jgi:hypothetical protein
MAFFRQFTAQVLLTIVSAVSFLGTGLHLLPGCDHFHDHFASCCEHADCHHQAAHHDSNNCHSDSDCAICQLLAIPWAPTSPPTIVDCGRPFEVLVVASVNTPPAEALPLYGARAPPWLPAIA